MPACPKRFIAASPLEVNHVVADSLLAINWDQAYAAKPLEVFAGIGLTGMRRAAYRACHGLR